MNAPVCAITAFVVGDSGEKTPIYSRPLFYMAATKLLSARINIGAKATRRRRRAGNDSAENVIYETFERV